MKYRALLLFILTFNKLYAQTAISQPALDSLTIACKKSHSASFSVFFNGRSVTDFTLNKDNKQTECYSVLKSIASLAIGKLITDGKLTNVDKPVSDFYPEWKQGLKRKIIIKELLNHTSGIEFHEENPEDFGSRDIVQFALCASIVDTPGTKFLYNTKAFSLLLDVIGKASGIKTDNYIEQNIFEPLGIRNYKWAYDSVGNVKDLLTTSTELVKIGQLVLNNGSWNNYQLISKDWISQMLQPSQPFVPDCGLLWWLIPETIHYIVDDSLLAEFKQAGIKQSVIDKFKLLEGDYVNVNIPPDKLKAVFGEDWQSFLDKEFYPYFPVRSRREYSSKIIGYKAEGYLGQYIIIYPDKKLVAARMVRKTDQYKVETDEMMDFARYVYKLVK